MPSTTKITITKQNADFSTTETGIERRTSDKASGSDIITHDTAGRFLQYWNGSSNDPINTIPVVGSDPTSVSNNDIWINSADNKLRYRLSGSTFTPNTDTTGATAGSSMSVIAGETIEARRAVYLSSEPALIINDSNKYIDINEGASDIVVSLSTNNYLFNRDQNRQEFIDMVKNSFTDAGAGGLVYSTSYNINNNKITIAASGGNFSMKFKTGTHGSDNAADNAAFMLGHVSTSDLSGAATYDSSSALSARTSVSRVVYGFKADASFPTKSKAALGIDSAGTVKYSTAVVNYMTTVGGFSDLPIGKKLLIQEGSINISSSANYIDFAEGGANLSATIPVGEYTWPYATLLDNYNTNMNAAGALTHSSSFDEDANKFTLHNSSSTFELKFQSGANTLLTIAPKLGFSTSDLTSSSKYTGDIEVSERGKLAISTSVPTDSRTIGSALSDTSMYVKRAEGTEYTDIINSSLSWLSTYSEADYSLDLNVTQIASNDAGQMVSVTSVLTGDETGYYKIRYKSSIDAEWSDATTTIVATSSGSASWMSAFWNTGLYYYAPKIAIDENGKAVICVIRYSSTYGKFLPWAYYSNDLDTWTVCTAGGLEGSLPTVDAAYSIGDIDIRDNKCVIMLSRTSDTNTELHISDNSGSGYVTMTRTLLSITSGFKSGNPSFMRIQYFPEQGTAATKYRIVMAGRGANNRTSVCTTLGDGTSLAQNADVFIGSGIDHPIAMGRDRLGDKNRIVIIGNDSTFDLIYQVDTNGDYNSGTLTLDNHSSQEINPSANVVETYNGDALHSTDARSLWHNENNRCIVLGSRAYVILGFDDCQEAWLMYADNFDNGSWSSLSMFAGGATDRATEWCMDHISSTDELVIGYRAFDSIANIRTKGQILFSRYSVIDSVPSLVDSFAQIDGGEVLTGYQAMLSVIASPYGAVAHWVGDNGANNTIRSNKLT